MTDRKQSNIAKVDIIRDQIRRIENKTVAEQSRIKARLLEKDEIYRTRNRMIQREIQKANPKAKNYVAKLPTLQENNKKHHLQ
jgi:hypothetical protein